MDILVKNLHLGILVYALYSGFLYFEEQDTKLVDVTSRAESMNAKLIRVRKDLSEVKKFEADIETSKARVREVVNKIETIQKQLPSDIKDSEISETLIGFAKTLRILNPSPLPKEEENKEFYFSKDYSFDASGTFLQFIIFFEKLEKLAKDGRILNVKYVRMKISDKSNSKSRFQILDLSTTLEAYRYNDQFDVRDL